MSKILYKGMLYTIRISPKANIIAIPRDTTIRIIDLEIIPDVTNSTCPASICKSGSATETKNPSSNPAIPTIQIFLLLTIAEPIKEPIGVIPMSTPTNKTANPRTINNPPSRNLPNVTGSRGTKVKFSSTTINVIGNTENKASFIFSNNAFNNMSLPFQLFKL